MLSFAQVSEQLAPAMLLGNRPLGRGRPDRDVRKQLCPVCGGFSATRCREPGWHVSHSPVNGALHLEVERSARPFTTVVRMTYLFAGRWRFALAEPDLIVNLYRGRAGGRGCLLVAALRRRR